MTGCGATGAAPARSDQRGGAFRGRRAAQSRAERARGFAASHPAFNAMGERVSAMLGRKDRMLGQSVMSANAARLLRIVLRSSVDEERLPMIATIAE